MPKDKAGSEKFKNAMLPAWEHTLLVEWPEGTLVERTKLQERNGCVIAELFLNRPSEDRKLSAIYFAPTNISATSWPKLVVLAGGEGAMSLRDEAGAPAELAKKLVDSGNAVLVIKEFSTGEPPNQFTNFFTTYNRTKVQERVRDLMSACAAVGAEAMRTSHVSKPFKVVLCGVGRAGLWSLLTAPAADAVVADCDALDVLSDETLLEPDLFCPGIRNIGTFEGVAMLAAPHPLLLHNVGKRFATDAIRRTYKIVGSTKQLRIESKPLTDDALVEWISRLE